MVAQAEEAKKQRGERKHRTNSYRIERHDKIESLEYRCVPTVLDKVNAP